jgi:hypothetical protein
MISLLEKYTVASRQPTKMYYLHFLVAAYCIYLCIPLISNLSLVAPKQYRIDRYTMYNCDKGLKNEYVIYTKATMKISGGKDEIVSAGYFEILQDIHEEIIVSNCLYTVHLSLMK